MFGWQLTFSYSQCLSSRTILSKLLFNKGVPLWGYSHLKDGMQAIVPEKISKT
jgi:hypothetical protein